MKSQMFVPVRKVLVVQIGCSRGPGRSSILTTRRIVLANDRNGGGPRETKCLFFFLDVLRLKTKTKSVNSTLTSDRKSVV